MFRGFVYPAPQTHTFDTEIKAKRNNIISGSMTFLGISRWSLVLGRRCHDSPPVKVILSYLVVALTTQKTKKTQMT